MKQRAKFEIPDSLQPTLKKAKRLEWFTIFYLISTAIAVYLTMGNSQAMKTAWFEDLISLTPAISFLIAARVSAKSPNANFPYGYHRSVNIAYLCSAVALFAVGAFLIFDSSMTLIKKEHPTIGTVVLFGHQVWLGYLMIVVLLYGSVPAMIIGRMKLPLSKKLHDKNLYTDAEMNRADWMTAGAAILGILGIGLGWWWADAVAAIVISIDILRDGFTNLKQAVSDLMDDKPRTVTEQQPEPLLEKVDVFLSKQPWVKKSTIRLREEGHLYSGEGYVIPVSEDNLVHNIDKTTEEIKKLDWRLHEFGIVPTSRLEENPND